MEEIIKELVYAFAMSNSTAEDRKHVNIHTVKEWLDSNEVSENILKEFKKGNYEKDLWTYEK